jgi:hypothetical protein
MLKPYAKEDTEEEQLAGLFLKVCPIVYKLCCPDKGFWPYSTEPVFENVNRAQESIPPSWESIPGLLKRFTKYGLWIVESLACILDVIQLTHHPYPREIIGVQTVKRKLYSDERSCSCLVHAVVYTVPSCGFEKADIFCRRHVN